MAGTPPRLTADFWIHAYLRRLAQENIPAYVGAKGDPTAGAVAVRLATLDGRAQAFTRVTDPFTGARAWRRLAEGPEHDIDAILTRERKRDPDLWVIEIEDRQGRTLLDTPGLAE